MRVDRLVKFKDVFGRAPLHELPAKHFSSTNSRSRNSMKKCGVGGATPYFLWSTPMHSYGHPHEAGVNNPLFFFSPIRRRAAHHCIKTKSLEYNNATIKYTPRTEAPGGATERTTRIPKRGPTQKCTTLGVAGVRVGYSVRIGVRPTD